MWTKDVPQQDGHWWARNPAYPNEAPFIVHRYSYSIDTTIINFVFHGNENTFSPEDPEIRRLEFWSERIEPPSV